VDADVAAETVEQLADVAITYWLRGALRDASDSEGCATPYAAPLDQGLLDVVVGLADSVTGELMANLDASLGAAAEWCSRGDESQAGREFADAAVTAQILVQRLDEIGA
jgi:hypothetical protein